MPKFGVFMLLLTEMPGDGVIYGACILSHFSRVWLFVTLWTIACQAALSVGFSRQEYWSCHFLLLVYSIFKNYLFIYLAVSSLSWACRILSCGIWDLVPWPRIKPRSPHLECRVLATRPLGKSLVFLILIFILVIQAKGSKIQVALK